MFKRIMVALTTVLLSAALMLTPGLVATANAAPAANGTTDCRAQATKLGAAMAEAARYEKRVNNSTKKFERKKVQRKKARTQLNRAKKQRKKAKRKQQMRKLVVKRQLVKQRRKKLKRRKVQVQRWKKRVQNNRKNLADARSDRATYTVLTRQACQGTMEGAPAGVGAIGNLPVLGGIIQGFIDAFGGFGSFDKAFDPSMFFDLFGDLFAMSGNGADGADIFDPSMFFKMFGVFTDMFGELDPHMLEDLFSGVGDFGDFSDMFSLDQLMKLFTMFGDMGSFGGMGDIGGLESLVELLDPSILMDMFGTFADLGSFGEFGDMGGIADMFDPSILMDLFGTFGDLGADAQGGLLRLIPVVGPAICDASPWKIPILC